MQTRTNKNTKNKKHTIKQGKETQATTFTFYTNNNMTEKEKALVEALCDAFGFDYPEA